MQHNKKHDTHDVSLAGRLELGCKVSNASHGDLREHDSKLLTFQVELLICLLSLHILTKIPGALKWHLGHELVQ